MSENVSIGSLPCKGVLPVPDVLFRIQNALSSRSCKPYAHSLTVYGLNLDENDTASFFAEINVHVGFKQRVLASSA